MNDDVKSRSSVVIGENLKSQLTDGIVKMLGQINTGKTPSIQECDDLQSLFRQYLDALLMHRETLADGSNREKEQTLEKVLFSDVSGDDVKSNDIIADLLSDPSVINVLYSVGMRKLLKEDELALSDAQMEWLQDKGYIAPLMIVNGENSEKFIALTSKGWLTFQRKNIAQQIRRTQGYTALFLPEWLVCPQTKWNPEAYRRAALLSAYYENGTENGRKDYMMFTFPENPQLVFGNLAEETNRVSYTCPVPDIEMFTENDQSTLGKVTASVAVNQIVLVVPNEAIGKKLIESLNLRESDSSKISIHVLEAAHE